MSGILSSEEITLALSGDRPVSLGVCQPGNLVNEAESQEADLPHVFHMGIACVAIQIGPHDIKRAPIDAIDLFEQPAFGRGLPATITAGLIGLVYATIGGDGQRVAAKLHLIIGYEFGGLSEMRKTIVRFHESGRE